MPCLVVDWIQKAVITSVFILLRLLRSESKLVRDLNLIIKLHMSIQTLLPAHPPDMPTHVHQITGHLLTLCIMSCSNEGVVNNDNSTLTKSISHIKMRVRGGNFEIKFDGSKLEPISLNVTHEELFQHHLKHLHQHSQTFWMVWQIRSHSPKPFLYISREVFLGLPVP